MRPYHAVVGDTLVRIEASKDESRAVPVETWKRKCDRCGWKTLALPSKDPEAPLCACGGRLRTVGRPIKPINGGEIVNEPLSELQKAAMRGKETTESQRGFLAKLGHVGAIPLDRAEASKLIDALLEARRNGGL